MSLYDITRRIRAAEAAWVAAEHAATTEDHAIERLGEGATIPQMEAVVKRADGSPNAVVVAGQPIDMNGEACMLFTFMDLEPRKQAERAQMLNDNDPAAGRPDNSPPRNPNASGKNRNRAQQEGE